MKRNQSGYFLVMVVLALTILLILVPLILTLNQKESKDSAGVAKKTKAFQLAEAGQDRGSWKLRESSTMWNNASTGAVISGYHNDSTYSDVAGGQYKILITSGPGAGQVTIISKGLATNGTDLRAIKGIYSKGTVSAGLSVVGGINWKPNLKVEWGPVVTYASITQTPAERYPRKYSAGAITGYDTDPNAPNGAMPGNNWSTYDYASYYDLGSAPTINTDSYRNLAKNCCVPLLDATSGPGAAAHTNAPSGCGSGYYTADVNIDNPPGVGGNYILTCATCVIFVEGNVQSFPNNAWLNIQALLATGSVDFNAKNTVYVATIPAGAQQEYQYVPDATTYWASKGWNDDGNHTYSVSNCGMHGFLYSGGDISNSGGTAIMVGAIFVAGSGGITVNTMTVYYDKSVADNILYQNSSISRVSWDETRTSW